ncbi:uncharacterized protein PHACADRAFT_198408 [Phanerochaete carnosa HHB-10118-sp]|uniref:Major facilitator superfamily (MFS) profile domain-containing protein n=1 Tax=Phanerochaete carnosa (strain HHB-10118-sp) TaxID=650164 RepID=K5UR69_PHACS|nr:uncharacterized protein PHACADRAFT_198408 [Phanerochaete carnosa HHB-10118-sp]EKM52346.1 hypothetical protein PHACADRAFT_198408 [Phanerochaete carnosa HHB-10118-sp]
MPVYFQACRDASPIRSAVDTLGLCLTVRPALIISGIVIAATKTYHAQLVVVGALSTLTTDSSTAHGIGFLIIMGIGSGIFYSAAYFPVLAPLPASENSHALALFACFRSFAGVWGVTIGTAVLQTQLTHRLPAAFLAQFPGGISLAYDAVAAIRMLEEPLKQEVRVAFAQSLRIVWEVSIGIVGLGFLSTLLMKGLPLHTQMDEKWALEAANAARPVGVELEPTEKPNGTVQQQANR